MDTDPCLHPRMRSELRACAGREGDHPIVRFVERRVCPDCGHAEEVEPRSVTYSNLHDFVYRPDP